MTDLEYLKVNEPDYYPSAEVIEQLDHVVLTMLIGPALVGKSACMNQIVNSDTNGVFGKAQSFTTRPKRPSESDDEYRYLSHDNDAVSGIAEAARHGDLVQYAVHPTTGFIYGSDRHDYHSPYMMLDTLASSVGTIRRVPFGKITEISIVAEPEQWQRRLGVRGMAPSEARKRIIEGKASLRWSLDQDDSMAWVCNDDGKLSIAGDEIRGIVLGDRDHNPLNRKIGERLLYTLESLV